MFNEKDIYLNLQNRLVSAGFEHGAKLRAEVIGILETKMEKVEFIIL